MPQMTTSETFVSSQGEGTTRIYTKAGHRLTVKMTGADFQAFARSWRDYPHNMAAILDGDGVTTTLAHRDIEVLEFTPEKREQMPARSFGFAGVDITSGGGKR